MSSEIIEKSSALVSRTFIGVLGTVDENGIPQQKAMIKTAAIGIKEFWNDGMKMYYPLGCTDPDYALIKFTASRGNYYHGLKNMDFDI